MSQSYTPEFKKKMGKVGLKDMLKSITAEYGV